MINVYKNGERLIGVFKSFISFTELQDKDHLTGLKEIITEQLLIELDKEENSGLFAYKILNIIHENDIFGYQFVVEFEFVPNKELVEELKVVSERLEIGL